jgi:hypothetical protein
LIYRQHSRGVSGVGAQKSGPARHIVHGLQPVLFCDSPPPIEIVEIMLVLCLLEKQTQTANGINQSNNFPEITNQFSCKLMLLPQKPKYPFNTLIIHINILFIL